MNVGVAFDLEGTSVDLEQHRHAAHLEAAATFGIAIGRDFAVAQIPNFVGGPDIAIASNIFALMQDELKMPKAEFVTEFLRRDKEIFEERLSGAKIQPRAGLENFIEWLRAQDLPVAIGSLTSHEQATVILARSGLDDLFGSNVVLREDVPLCKPAPDVYFQTAKLMDVRPPRQIVFDDSKGGIIAARSAESHAIAMPVIFEDSLLSSLMAARAYAIFKDWRDPQLKQYVQKIIDRLGKRKLEESTVSNVASAVS